MGISNIITNNEKASKKYKKCTKYYEVNKYMGGTEHEKEGISNGTGKYNGGDDICRVR